MKNIFGILLISLLCLFALSTGNSYAQTTAEKEKTGKANPNGESGTVTNKSSPDNEINLQSKGEGNKKEPVKQVKSARPDMTKSRGARPPDIVRPSGSRIPKGVGRPAGAAMHGR